MKFPLYLLGVAILIACSTDPSTGTGSQTGNSIVAGRVARTDTAHLVGTKVYLRPLNWTASQTAAPNALQTTITDSLGNFAFQNVPTTVYRIEARHDNHGWSKTIWAIPGSKVTVPTGTLVPVGKLVCEFEMNESIAGALIELYGLDRFHQLPNSATGEFKFTFDSLPVGLQTVRIWSKKTNSALTDLPVRIGPDSVSKIEYEQWGHESHGPREDD